MKSVLHAEVEQVVISDRVRGRDKQLVVLHIFGNHERWLG